MAAAEDHEELPPSVPRHAARSARSERARTGGSDKVGTGAVSGESAANEASAMDEESADNGESVDTGEATDGATGTKPAPRRHPVLSFLRESAIVLVAALILSLIIKTFFAQSFYIPSESMETTLMVGDRLVVNKLAPDVMDLHRGDVVVFLDPGGWLNTAPHELNVPEQVLTWIGLLPEHADEHLIKRVIGTGGDHVVCCTAEGLITVNGEPISEPYVIADAVPSEEAFDVTVPADHLFVLGDNRPRSADSRFHLGSVGGGFVPVRNVVGTAFVITWPLDRITWLSNPTDTFADVPDP